MTPPSVLLLRELPWQADSACLMQRLHPLPGAVFFDSSMNRERGGRYDILTACPSITLTLHNGRIQRQAAGARATEITPDAADIFAAVKQMLSAAPATPEALKDLPFTGGAAGYFAYDALPAVSGGAPARTRPAGSRPTLADVRGDGHPQRELGRDGREAFLVVGSHHERVSGLRPPVV